MSQDSSRLLGRRCIRCSLSHISILRRRRSRNRRRKEEKVEFMSHRCLLEAKKRANERASLFLSLPLSNKRPLAPPFPSLLSPPSLLTSWRLGLPQVYVPSRIADILPPPGKSSIRIFVICATFFVPPYANCRDLPTPCGDTHFVLCHANMSGPFMPCLQTRKLL